MKNEGSLNVHEKSLVAWTREGELSAIVCLVEIHNVDPDFQDSEGSATALMTAAQRGHIDIVKYLLTSTRADVNKQDKELKSALIIAAMSNKIECVKLLLECGADPNLFSRNGWTALYVAAQKGYLEITLALLCNCRILGNIKAVDVDMRINNTVGGSVLMVASMQGHKEIVEHLINRGANVNIKDKNNWTALMKAADKGHSEVVALLIEKGAEVNNTDKAGCTALILTAKAGMTEAVVALLSCPETSRLIINQQDKDNRTALFYAAQNGHLEVVKALMRSGADPSIEDKHNDTASIVAKDPTGKIQEELNKIVLPVSGEKQPDAEKLAGVPSLTEDMQNLNVAACDASPKDVYSAPTRTYPHPIALELQQLDADYTVARWCGDTEAAQRVKAAALVGNNYADAYLALLYRKGCRAFAVDFDRAKRHGTLFFNQYTKRTSQYRSWTESYCCSTESFLLGELYMCGVGVLPSKELAMQRLYEAASQGHANAQCTLGRTYLEDKDPVEAVKWFESAVKKRHSESLYQLGRCYATGSGIVNNSTSSTLCFQQAAAAGHTRALRRYGICCEQGKGTLENHYKAFESYQLSANKGDLAAQLKLAQCYHNSIGVSENLVKAAENYAIAADRGCVVAQLSLALMLFNSAPRSDCSDRKAADYFKLAADQENADAQYLLGVCLELGRGVNEDLSEALTYYRRAESHGHSCARINLAFCLVSAVPRTPAATNEAMGLLDSIYMSLRRNAQFADFPTLSILMPRQQDRAVLTQIDNRYLLRFLNERSLDLSDARAFNVAVSDQWIQDASPVLKAGLVFLLLRGMPPFPINVAMSIHIVRNPLLSRSDTGAGVTVMAQNPDAVAAAYHVIQEVLRDAQRVEMSRRYESRTFIAIQAILQRPPPRMQLLLHQLRNNHGDDTRNK